MHLLQGLRLPHLKTTALLPVTAHTQGPGRGREREKEREREGERERLRKQRERKREDVVGESEKKKATRK